MGSRPTEKIRRRMVEAMKVLMPEGRGNVMTTARETNIAAHTRPDIRVSNSKKQAWNLFYFTVKKRKF